MTLVCLEIGKKRTFASALEWPGWARSGRGEAEALDALATYADRYREVVEVAGFTFVGTADDFVVVERLPGDMSTDFGAPGAVAAWEREPAPAGQAPRLAALLQASWTVLDRVVALTPPGLRKGPRGGGRDRDAMVDHVLGAEVAFARKIGVRHRQPAHDDAVAIAALRGDLADVILRAGDGPAQAWPSRYAVRRIAWHVLDHAWEMQDRTDPG
jgi:hypothetical protein